MTNLLRAEWIRFRRRRAIQAIVVIVLLLISVQFLAGALSTPEPAPFDEAAVRAELIAQGYGAGLPPDEAERLIAQGVEAERQGHAIEVGVAKIARAAYAFPRSLLTVLGSASLVLLAMILLTATTIGDDFGWGTIRTTLLANSRRSRVLLARIIVLAATGIVLFAIVLLLGALLPLLVGPRDVNGLPAVDWLGIVTLLVGLLAAMAAVIAFSALATVIVRSGGLTLVAAPVYLVLEAAVLSVLVRVPVLQPGHEGAWLLDGFPVHGLVTLTEVAARAASGLGHFPGDVVDRSLGPVAVPIVALAAWAGVFALLAFKRFGRMDIAE